MPHNLFPTGKYPLDRHLMEVFSKKMHTEFEELDGKDVYGRINSPAKDGATEEYQVSLMTDCMIRQDARFIKLTRSSLGGLALVDEKFLQGYHPFFFEFYGKKKRGKYILRDDYPKWKRMKLYFSNDREFSNKDVVLQGIVIFGVSPLKRRSAYLVFVCDADEVHCKADFSVLLADASKYGNNTMRGRYIELLDSTQNIEGIIWNVGQANCVSLMLDQKEIFFDIGLPVNGSIPYGNRNCARNHMRRATPIGIVLSHWDMDHVIGVVEIGAELPEESSYNVYTNCCWIAPDLSEVRNKSLSAERLCFYLLRQGLIWLVNHVDTSTPVIQQSTSILSLWKGNGCDSNGGRKNNIGLVIKLDYPSISEPQSVLLTGDCAYEALPQDLKEAQYGVVLSPHHGSEKTLPSFCAKDHNARAIISVGENKYNHPRIEHITELVERGFRVYFTAGCDDIRVFLKSNQKVCIRRCCNNNKSQGDIDSTDGSEVVN